MAFWPNIGIFGPWQTKKTMRTRCLCGFSFTKEPKLLLPPVIITIFGPKMAKFGRKYALLVILGQILAIWPISSNALPKYNAIKVPRWFFRYVGTKTFASSQNNKDFWRKNSQIWPKTGIFWPIFPMQTKNNSNKVPRCFFPVCGYQNFCSLQ